MLHKLKCGIEIEGPSISQTSEIIKSLQRQCRFNGNVNVFWSIAHHSILVESLVSAKYKKLAIMHDFAEAIIGDIISPIKRACPVIKSAENELLARIGHLHNVDLVNLPEIVKMADQLAFHRERMYLQLGGSDGLISLILGMSDREVYNHILNIVK